MQVDDQFLKEMGLEGLQGEAKQKALEDILYTLNMRVGKRVAELLNESQAAEFVKLSDDASEEELSGWLQKNVPGGAQLIEEEARAMRDEAQTAVQRVMNQTDSTPSS